MRLRGRGQSVPGFYGALAGYRAKQTKKFCHYFLAHTIHLITKYDRLRYLLSRPIISGRVARWLLMLAEFDIQCLAPCAILSQAMADLVAQFPSGNFEPVHDDLPYDEFESLCCADENMMGTLSFNRLSTSTGGGAGVVLTHEEGRAQNLSYKLTFGCSNNTMEYEALVFVLLVAWEAKIKRLHVQGDSNLVIKQLDGSYAIKEPALVAYRIIIQKLSNYFNELRITHAPQTANRHPDALATLASKVEITGESVDIRIHKKDESWLHDAEFTDQKDEEDWQGPYESQLKGGMSEIPLLELKNFALYLGVLYFRTPDGTLARCVGSQEDREEAALLRKEARQFFICNGELMRRGFDGKAKRCVNSAEAREILKQFMKTSTKGGKNRIIVLYSWAIIGPRCKLTAEIVSESAENAKSIVEAIALSTATGQVVANFIKESIICRFGVPRVIISDNGTPFVNSRVRALLRRYQMAHHKSTPYYLKGNGQAEATNKTFIRILSRTLKEQHDKWAEQLPLALWAYRTATRGTTGTTPLSLVYGTEAVLLIEIVIPSGSLAEQSQP
ncbi:uncharacterized protein LOC132281120 [Cornus florida]|uniref:uncharacterized protein LOC132281120 n=1 Tax=Cornus florida TaxID=4283 RepID=UPI00289A70C0|nr:uncharacterized protein LOC132281120 [Cornus florida]